MSVHENWLTELKAFQDKFSEFGINLQLPPPSVLELQLEYLEIVPGIKMKAKVPFQKKFTNPVHLYQGGFLAAAIDDVFGPLSYISAQRPCVTLSLNMTYLKAFTQAMSHCFIEAQILQQTKSFIFMRAEVTTESGELIAHAESHVSIMRDEQLAKVKV
jgi:uncharacterized protein (TIGR00369 family)